MAIAHLERVCVRAKISILIFAAFVPASAAAQDYLREDEPEVLEKGPIHEAFAAPAAIDPDEAYVIPHRPPPLVEELPPDSKPDGANVQWIPGYWAWDEDLQQFIWVSGVWRDIPPGKHWVPGYFTEVTGGWRWVPGYWASDVESRPIASAPPQSLEVGPSTEPPPGMEVWNPGVWVWVGHWAWRPGAWIAADPDWIWVPAYYIWTPGGYLLVGGYWDYLIVRRGFVFAPVYWPRGWHPHRHHRWQPVVTIKIEILLDHLFYHRRYSHYYFGDYHGAKRERGIHPWPSRERHSPILPPNKPGQAPPGSPFAPSKARKAPPAPPYVPPKAPARVTAPPRSEGVLGPQHKPAGRDQPVLQPVQPSPQVKKPVEQKPAPPAVKPVPPPQKTKPSKKPAPK